jgi:hypothetical protein
MQYFTYLCIILYFPFTFEDGSKASPREAEKIAEFLLRRLSKSNLNVKLKALQIISVIYFFIILKLHHIEGFFYSFVFVREALAFRMLSRRKSTKSRTIPVGFISEDISILHIALTVAINLVHRIHRATRSCVWR